MDLEPLGHQITDGGIQKDLYEFDAIAEWPSPANKELLARFSGDVDYLADRYQGTRTSKGIQDNCIGSTRRQKWGPTEQHTREEIMRCVEDYAQVTHEPLDYGDDSTPMRRVTDASATGAASHIIQGADTETAQLVTFGPERSMLDEHIYTTHEQELLAIIQPRAKISEEVKTKLGPLLVNMVTFIHKDAPPIRLTTDPSVTGASDHICRGADWETAHTGMANILRPSKHILPMSKIRQLWPYHSKYFTITYRV
jgi:hypothetical protein